MAKIVLFLKLAWWNEYFWEFSTFYSIRSI